MFTGGRSKGESARRAAEEPAPPEGSFSQYAAGVLTLDGAAMATRFRQVAALASGSFAHLVVHNKRKPFDVYIGRNSAGIQGCGQTDFSWGNPFSTNQEKRRQIELLGREESAVEVGARYMRWLLSEPELVERARTELRGRVLGCWCSPNLCHGHILSTIANEAPHMSAAEYIAYKLPQAELYTICQPCAVEPAAGEQPADGAADRAGSCREATCDRLRPFFSSSELARTVLEALDTEGYIVLPQVFSREEVAAEYDRMWGFVEKVSPGLSRDEPSSWWARDKASADPWPHTMRDMFQLHQAGWLFNDLREMMAARVFEPLYGRELHVSKDGFTFHRPTGNGFARTANDHFDQGTTMLGLQCVQGSVALTDQQPNDGCFAVWPGSFKSRMQILEELPAYRKNAATYKDFNIIPHELMHKYGYEQRRVPVNAGDVVLWRSDVAHCGASPIGARDSFRAVVYICCLPAVLTPAELLPKKQRGYEQLATTNHWPCQENWFEDTNKVNISNVAVASKQSQPANRRNRSKQKPQLDARPYYDSPPVLTARQQELYALRPYHPELRQTRSMEVADAAGVTRQEARGTIDQYGGDWEAALEHLLNKQLADIAASMQPQVEDGEDLRGALAARAAVMQHKLPVPKRGRRPRNRDKKK